MRTPPTAPPTGQPFWDLELFSALEMMDVLTEYFSRFGYPPSPQLQALRAKVELAAW